MDLMSLSEDEALHLLAKLRWGENNEQVCSECGVVDHHSVIRTRKQWRCKHCFHTFSVTSGTILADHKLTYRQMLVGVYLFTTASNGISALRLSREINVTYKTALLFLHKLKEAIIHHRDLSPMQGTVQIDGTYIGGKPRKDRLRKRKNHQAVIDKIESGGKQRGRMTRNEYRNWKRRQSNRRLIMVFRDINAGRRLGGKRTIVILTREEKEEYAKPLVERFIIPGSIVMTDENGAYNFLSTRYDHRTVEHSKEYATPDGINNNQAESFNSRLKRWYYGVSHRAMPQYIFDYACEMAWREDMRRTSEKTRFTDIWQKVFKCGLSSWWRGYHQGVRRNNELLMYF